MLARQAHPAPSGKFGFGRDCCGDEPKLSGPKQIQPQRIFRLVPWRSIVFVIMDCERRDAQPLAPLVLKVKMGALAFPQYCLTEFQSVQKLSLGGRRVSS